MGIKNIKLQSMGQPGVQPEIIYIQTDDTMATVTATGYLNNAQNKMNIQFKEDQMALVSTKTTPNATATEVAWLEISKSGDDWSLVSTLSPGSAVLPTIANYLAHFSNTTGTITNAAANVINAGNIQAGIDATAGTFISHPATTASGTLVVAAVDNTGDTDVTISNAAHGQATVASIPDGGQATTEFIIADSAGTQNITSGALQVDAGAVTSGLAAGGFVGAFNTLATTTASGGMNIAAAVNATGDFGTTLSNSTAQAQAQVISIPDVGAATGSVLVSTIVDSDPNANIVTFDVTCGQAALATGGSVVLYTSNGAEQFKIRELYFNDGGTDFSGGGGDRLGAVTDGTTVYSVVPAASMQTLANGRWGDTTLAFPASAAINVSTVAAADLVFEYSGGGTDYTAGSVVISGVLERVV